MEIALFAKKRTTSEGKSFVGYWATLVSPKTGEITPVTVKFKDDKCKPVPLEDCPCMITLQKGDCSLTKPYEFESKDGTVGIGRDLWVYDWVRSGDYVDHSMDEYFDE